MTTPGVRTATIEIHRTHWATLEPVVPEVRDRLRRRVLELYAGGPLGHGIRPVVSDGFAEVIVRRRYDDNQGRIERSEVQVVPHGLVPEVLGWLEELGYDVERRDHREDSPRWVRDGDWRTKTRG